MITKLIDEHIKLSETTDIPILYIAMSQTHVNSLTNNILEAAGMEPNLVEFDGVKNYRGVTIRIHTTETLKFTYKL